jgi:hypothetical protein
VHAHRAEADIVDARNIPAAMVETGRDGFHQRKEMMIAAVDAMHERDEIGGAVGQAQAKRPFIEGDRFRYVARENQHV